MDSPPVPAGPPETYRPRGVDDEGGSQTRPIRLVRWAYFVSAVFVLVWSAASQIPRAQDRNHFAFDVIDPLSDGGHRLPTPVEGAWLLLGIFGPLIVYALGLALATRRMRVRGDASLPAVLAYGPLVLHASALLLSTGACAIFSIVRPAGEGWTQLAANAGAAIVLTVLAGPLCVLSQLVHARGLWWSLAVSLGGAAALLLVGNGDFTFRIPGFRWL